ncbi:Aste57867_24787 [Aphanomyces stellatus]|uniref:Aste57867_24787 protein n=1 Tax=Aphanomyces stellatus TaxID=120398 RepID=A0A485LRC3_9STRA|nr:hypothetical protein As57867_024709 [Aphanomyces stellatus]VFU01422.1 Aste57867_24787 [Aphanomyces stellatus]
MKQLSMSSTSTSAALLPSRLLRSLNTWTSTSSSNRVSASTYSYKEVDHHDDATHLLTPEFKPLESSSPLSSTRSATAPSSFACHLASPAALPSTPPRTGTFDVLLQKDANGLGFCLAMDELTQESLVVTSFRRLHAGDIGPAEASNAIQPGDVLLAIDGDRVHSLPQVQAKIVASEFVLLQFYRGPPRSVADMLVAPSSADKASSPTRVVIPPRTQREMQMALVVQDMAVKNQLLLTQLTEANLTIGSQAAEIDALQAQVMQMRLDREMQSFRGWTHGMLSKASPAKAKAELDHVVTEAHRELKRSAMQHLEFEKQALRAETSASVDAWKAAVLKKQAMLEEALVFMVDHLEEAETKTNAFDKSNNDPVDDKQDETTNKDGQKLEEIRAILDKYFAARRRLDEPASVVLGYSPADASQHIQRSSSDGSRRAPLASPQAA